MPAPMLSAISRVANALTVGSSEVRTMPQTRVGRVLPLPMVKKVMTKSSSEIESAISAAPTMVGRMIGRVTVRNAVEAEAPRSRALSRPRSRRSPCAHRRSEHEGLHDDQLTQSDGQEFETKIEEADEGADQRDTDDQGRHHHRQAQDGDNPPARRAGSLANASAARVPMRPRRARPPIPRSGCSPAPARKNGCRIACGTSRG